MEFDDRIEGLIIGCLIGFIFGYITRILREIKDELHEVKSKVDEVDYIVTENHPETHMPREKREEGAVRKPSFMDILLFVVICVTFYSAVMSQKATNDIEAAQERDEQIISCIITHLELTTTALNQRTTFATKQAEANVALQREQAQFLHTVMSPDASEETEDAALRDYVTALTDFVAVNAATKVKDKKFPYPTREQLTNCLEPR